MRVSVVSMSVRGVNVSVNKDVKGVNEGVSVRDINEMSRMSMRLSWC